MSPPIAFDNSYATLPEAFFSRQAPRPVREPTLIRVNESLAARLGIDPALLTSDDGAAIVAGNLVPEGAEPIALAYAGHQFGQFNPRLGDGRAILLGEVVAPDGTRFDLQLKGSGVTSFSRGGDGRAPLGPVLREYIVSEAMAALGIPTTRSLAAATTGEPVVRDRRLPGAVLLRVARSHIRVGTFEYFAARGDVEALGRLLDHVIVRHAPDAADAATPALAFLKDVSRRQADLVAKWQLVGFIHGVMNTDNMLVSGETIDYGPCAFMDGYDPAQVYSSIDHHGRYAYENQPRIAQWNIACLARALLPLIAPSDDADLSEVQQVVDAFPEQYARSYTRGLFGKLGLSTEEPGDAELVRTLMTTMESERADFTLTFRALADQADPDFVAREPNRAIAGVFEPSERLRIAMDACRDRARRDPRPAEERAAEMRRLSPAVIPRNHLVEAAIRDAEDRGDFGRFHALVDVLADPSQYDASLAAYARPPRPEECVHQTFCGT